MNIPDTPVASYSCTYACTAQNSNEQKLARNSECDDSYEQQGDASPGGDSKKDARLTDNSSWVAAALQESQWYTTEKTVTSVNRYWDFKTFLTRKAVHGLSLDVWKRHFEIEWGGWGWKINLRHLSRHKCNTKTNAVFRTYGCKCVIWSEMIKWKCLEGGLGFTSEHRSRNEKKINHNK